jgi:hypothetical protein
MPMGGSQPPTELPVTGAGGRPVPAIARGARTGATLFGNSSVPRGSDNTHAAGYALMADLGMTTIREGWNWNHVEVGKHRYVDWMSYFDDKVAQFASMGVQVQAMITDTPDWASSDPQYAGKTGWDGNSPGRYTVPAGLHLPIFADGTDVYRPGLGVNRDNYFASYLYDMVTRYKGRIRYWQMWNEPDYPSGDQGPGTTGSNGASRSWMGSVADYVRLLQVGATLVHGIDPSAKVTLGGLGYETYLAAILEQGGAPYFDVVDFHAYGSDHTTSESVLTSSWGFLGRYRAMKQVLADHGITGKAFGCSETGFPADDQAEQANYVDKLFATAVAQGDIETVQWGVFTNPGFNDIGLIDQATLTQKTQGYLAYRFASRQLGDARVANLPTDLGVSGYRFEKPNGSSLYVLWSQSGSKTVELPFARASVFDHVGQLTRSWSGSAPLSLSAGRDPTWVLTSP